MVYNDILRTSLFPFIRLYEFSALMINKKCSKEISICMLMYLKC